jgi:nucleoid-associated protein YgaU
MTPDHPPKPDFSDVSGGASSSAPIPPSPERPPEARQHTVVRGDSLSRIAKAVYGNASKWRVIYEANRDTIGSNPDLIQPGQVLVIPNIDAEG